MTLVRRLIEKQEALLFDEEVGVDAFQVGVHHKKES